MEPIKQVEFDRSYDAPLEKVWQAWTEPEQLKQWWGPQHVDIPECEVDLRVGGRFYIVMQAGDAMGEYAGTRWPMEAMFTTVTPQSALAYDAKAWTEGDESDTQIQQTTEIHLSEENGQTHVHLVAAIHSTGPKAGAAVEGMQYGFAQQFDKLAAFLQK